MRLIHEQKAHIFALYAIAKSELRGKDLAQALKDYLHYSTASLARPIATINAMRLLSKVYNWQAEDFADFSTMSELIAVANRLRDQIAAEESAQQKTSHRREAYTVSYFLAKYHTKLIDRLGFASFAEAYRFFGFKFGYKPASFHNQQQYFEPLLECERLGWPSNKLYPTTNQLVQQVAKQCESYTLSQAVAIVEYICSTTKAPL